MTTARKSIECWMVTDSHTLLLHVPDRPGRTGFWQPVTGGIEPGEAPTNAAAREVFEETGARLELAQLEHVASHLYVEISNDVVIDKTLFLARVAPFNVQLSVDEHDDARFVPHADVASWIFWPSTHKTWGMVASLLKRI